MSIGGAARIYAWPGAGSLRLGDSWLVGRRRTSREKHPDLLNLASLCKTAVGTPEGVVKAKATATSVSSAVHFSFQEPVCAGPLPSPSSDPLLNSWSLFNVFQPANETRVHARKTGAG